MKLLLQSAAGRIKFANLTHATIWKMMERGQKAWSEKTLAAVQSEKDCRKITKRLGCPRMLVSPEPVINLCPFR